jgi:hypothetical protein
MRSVRVLAILLVLCLSANAQGLPGKAIAPSGIDSKGCAAVDTITVADCLVSQPYTKIAFRLVWDMGDGVTETIVLRAEVQNRSNGVLKAYEFHRRIPFLAGSVRLTPDDIAGLLGAEAASDFWAQPQASPPSEQHDGIVSLAICAGDGLSLAGVEADRRLVVTRPCPSEKTDPKLLAFARALIHAAQKHFPRLAADPKFWGRV